LTATDAASARAVLRGNTRTITGADTIVASDIGKTLLFNSSTAFTLAATSAAALGDGFFCWFKNINAGLVTLDPNSPETIDGRTTIIAPKGDSGMIVCDGTGFQTLERPTVVLIDGSAIASSTASFAVALPAGFDRLELTIRGFEPASSGASLQGLVSTNGGSSYAATGYRYGAVFSSDAASSGGTSLTSAGSASALGFGAGLPTGASAGGIYKLDFYGPSDSAYYHRMNFEAAILEASSGKEFYVKGGGTLQSASAWTHFKVQPSTGNIAALIWNLRGYRGLV